MKTLLQRSLLTTTLLVAVPAGSFAQVSADMIGFGIQAGTAGPGGHLILGFDPRLQLRLSAAGFSKSRNEAITGISIQQQRHTRISTGAYGCTFDWQPLSGWKRWRISAGLFLSQQRITQSRSYQLKRNDELIDLGSLTLSVYSKPLNPYLGIVFGNFQTEKNWLFWTEVGTLYQGSPRVDFTGKGLIAPTAEQDDIIREGLRYYRFFPVINFHFTYKIKFL